VLDGPINRDAFETYVEKVLVPELPEHAIVIMDKRMRASWGASTDRMGMATVLARAALVVLLSDYEAHPVAVMEALTLGRRVLVIGWERLSRNGRS
jgi:hypothetical protein